MPPHNLEAEQALLGSLLIDRDAVAAVADWVTPEAFYWGANATIYRAILALWSVRRPCDLVTLTDLLQSRRKLDEVGGVSYLAALISATPTAAHVSHYGELVVGYARRRAMIDAACDVVAETHRGELAIDDAVGSLRQAVEPFTPPRLEGTGTYAETMDDHLTRVLHRWEGQLDEHVVPTGIGAIDRIILGGFRGGDLAFIGARPGMGKTSSMLQMAHHAAAATDRVSLVVELEMSPEALRNRAIAAEAGVDFGVAYATIADQVSRERWLGAAERLKALPVAIERLPTTDRILAQCERLAAERPLGAIYIDHLDYLQDRVKGDAPEQRTAELTRRCKQLAMTLGVPVIVLAQLNREVEQRPPYVPALKHFRNSGAIEADTDYAFLLYRRKYYSDKGMLDPDMGLDYCPASPLHRAEWYVAKNRNGEVRSIDLGWDPRSMTFHEVRAA